MSLYSISLVLGVLANQALAGCGLSKLCPDPDPAGKWLNSCPKGIPKKWACLDPSIDFPTVDCIVADLIACGTLDKNQVLLYSYGATTVEVRTKVRDKLNPRPVMFNDALPDEWHDAMASEERFGLREGKTADPDVPKRNDAFVNRFSAALTKAAKGEVILVTASRTSKFGGSGAYSKPDPKTSKENVWRTYEFPLAQRNPDVTSVVSYALDEEPLKKVVDWEPGKGGEMLPEPRFDNPPLRKVNADPGPSGSGPKPLKPAEPAPGSSEPDPGSSKPAPGASEPEISPLGPLNPESPKPQTGPLGPLNPEPAKPKPVVEPPKPPTRVPGRRPFMVRRQEFMETQSNR